MAKQVRGPVEKEFARQNQRLLRNIKRRMAALSRQKTIYPGPAWEKFNTMVSEGKLKLTTRNLTREELKEQNRNLKYINSLKTSYVKNAKHFEKTWGKVLKELDKHKDKNITDRFFSLYNRLIEENAIWEHYKYELLDIVEEGVKSGLSDEEIRDNVIRRVNEIYDEENEIPIEDIKDKITF